MRIRVDEPPEPTTTALLACWLRWLNRKPRCFLQRRLVYAPEHASYPSQRTGQISDRSNCLYLAGPQYKLQVCISRHSLSCRGYSSLAEARCLRRYSSPWRGARHASHVQSLFPAFWLIFHQPPKSLNAVRLQCKRNSRMARGNQPGSHTCWRVPSFHRARRK